MCASHSCLAAPDIPEWVHELAMPVWVTTSDGTISYLNPRAETLIGHSAAACAGHPCHLVISGRTLEGAPLCVPRCRVRRLASRHQEMAPIPMRVAAAGGGQREVTVVVIHATDHQLVHCVVDAVTHARLREFIDHVARRAMHDTMRRRMQNDILTPREREILLLLEQGVTQKEIAARLIVSYTTVRNHVQHILGKLGVHSIMEAIAVSLTEEE
jgi:DNA-binding CsgD family transcriptional regulator